METVNFRPFCASVRRISASSCVGFTFKGTRNITSAVAVELKNNTAEVRGGGPLGCWSARKYYPLDNDPYRTGFHFQPPEFWMNDPNGPMYYKGLYHLFFQWNPFSNAGFANMHWG